MMKGRGKSKKKIKERVRCLILDAGNFSRQ
jgi:hypothetical protein